MRLVVFAFVVGACAPMPRLGARPPVDCPAAPPAAAQAYDSTNWRMLVGDFQLVLVLTSFVPDSGELLSSRPRLTLALADSAQRASALQRRLGHWPRRDLQLVGSYGGGNGYPAQPAEVDAGRLYLGCRDCNDASPLVIGIRDVAPEGFWGTWRDFQTGIGQLVDARTGKPVPDPEGYFCAWRVAGQ